MKPASWRAIAFALLAAALLVVAVDAATRAVSRAGEPADWSAARELLAANGDTVSTLALGEAALSNFQADGHGVLLTAVAEPRPSSELDAIAAFAARGGRVVILGDPMAAARLGSALASLPILPESAAFPGARPVLDARPGARIALRSANGTFVDIDGDGRASAGDAPGPFALATWAPGGRILVVGSPLWLDPSVLAQPEARAQASKLLADAFPPGTDVAIDESHAQPALAAAARAMPGALQDAGASLWIGGSIGLLVGAAGIAFALSLISPQAETAITPLDTPVRRRRAP